MSVEKINSSINFYKPVPGVLNLLPPPAKLLVSQVGAADPGSSQNVVRDACRRAVENLQKAVGEDAIRGAEQQVANACKNAAEEAFASRPSNKREASNSQITTQTTLPKSDVNAGTVLLGVTAVIIYFATLGTVQVQTP